ncbi:hypothetical protein IGS68_18030 [Skermanella sp. TT6]|uniref:Uncharacterized protein n=1 Tax=Skermanella cutis TaxID=2775420 RepID=A0ABX7B1C8_9PROT|nr:hypothetical protein [Skermanella sp. TT6]QQP87963.1 hypothetical protein IGS68_18030 [Skermanella sp. TT6]
MTLIRFLRQFIAAPKTIVIPPVWVSTARKGKTKVQFTAALDVAGVTQGGFELIGRATIEIADEDLTFQLQYTETKGRRTTPLSRIDWRPRHEHSNKGIGPLELRWSPFTECHIHDFNDNAELGDEIMREDNLPVAVLFQDPGSFEGLLTFAGEKMNIMNMELASSPAWPSAFTLTS